MTNLRIPGPTPCPDVVLKEMGRQMINHRGPEFKKVLFDVTDKLKQVFKTKNDELFKTKNDELLGLSRARGECPERTKSPVWSVAEGWVKSSKIRLRPVRLTLNDLQKICCLKGVRTSLTGPDLLLVL